MKTPLMRLCKPLFLFAILLSYSLAGFAASDRETQRKTYEQARQSLQSNQLTEFQRLRNQLDDYPLQGYLDYLYLRQRLTMVNDDSVMAFLEKHEDTFYAERLRQAMLDKLAATKQWSSFLRFYQESASAQRQCQYTQALIHTGQHQLAQQSAKALWLVGYSQPKACDPVFTYLAANNAISDDMRWERLRLALRNNAFGLARYLAKTVNASATALAWTERWETIHQNPPVLLNQLPAQVDHNRISLANDVPLAREIILHGLHRLARQDPDKAWLQWQRLKDAYRFSDSDRQQIHRQIGLWAALNRSDNALRYFGETQNEPWRVRAALWQQNWPAVKMAIASLDDNLRQEAKWQYWLARSLYETGDKEAAAAIWRTISDARDYYAFLAADRLDLDYQMHDRDINASAAEQAEIRQTAGYQRLYEFFHLNEDLEARREVYYLQNVLSKRQLELLALETHRWGWHDQTIALLGRAQSWDPLDQRFPLVHTEAIQQAAKMNKLDNAWLIAIARRESAFNPTARSHAGALGLMQVMPATGRSTAKLLGQPLSSVSELLQPESNIRIGSRYLKQVYSDLQRNPVLATAAYNAGPHRVNRWLPTQQALPADIWAENIPFNETRHYIRAVMSYAAIFDYQLQQPITRLKQRMPDVQPVTP
ncbi:Soluble lytic murein transglycosylase precursor [Methylophaga frappieri]|uniref:Soluble lytic murein transglycosylase n=1 Tax=Methylophaga frappieri (strain ATCC BAA-2434 / DSM 25690 / JAM7) TaxID=754477 RepID=I1YJ18_METFJ|nr:transglycosylase SLT domain-containing protein [Methylophaga frappieri]AFJ02911.1 Soluble lytic murein transglycosylase precursor [Methylophaga frappieri]